MAPLKTGAWAKAPGTGKTAKDPYVAKSGAKSWRAAYYDHEGVRRSKSFPSRKRRKDWIGAYYDALSSDNPDALRHFLIPEEPEVEEDVELTVRDLILDYFARDAAPDLVGGLAPGTFSTYVSAANVHICPPRPEDAPDDFDPLLGEEPASVLNDQATVAAWRGKLRTNGVGEEAAKRAKAVLSGATEWALTQPEYDISRNGCRGLRTTRRRSRRRAGTGAVAAEPGRAGVRPAWALVPFAVEAIRYEMLRRAHGDNPTTIKRYGWMPSRNAAYVSAQHGLAARNQEIWGLRWRYVGVRGPDGSDDWIHIATVLSWGALDEGKVSGALRLARVPSYLFDDLAAWRLVAEEYGFDTGPNDFVFPGVARAGHMTSSQAHSWNDRQLRPALREAIKRYPALAAVEKATAYSLRHGGISLRVRAGDDPATVAAECGTSIEMLSRRYAHALDLHGPRLPFADEVLDARQRVFGDLARRAA